MGPISILLDQVRGGRLFCFLTALDAFLFMAAIVVVHVII